MKKPLLAICAALIVLLIPMIVLASNGGDVGSIASQWPIKARTFNIIGKSLIYDTASRSGISVVLQRWSIESGTRVLVEINAMGKD